ncbi:hypothetical protein BR10RB9215_C20830 [Brucella sp. 10RB9215]|nr:hypothetical protein BCH_03330 [Brucella sp. 191011898]SBW16160.1 hypothetical protein BR10RB9215_C20830 [Brucella sp. 10RB9215]
MILNLPGRDSRKAPFRSRWLYAAGTKSTPFDLIAKLDALHSSGFG